VTAIDTAFTRARCGDPEGFADWVRAVERPLRSSLRGFARHVDVEAMLQEGLTRMWVLAPRVALTGDNASLRYALRLVRNLALREAERAGRFERLDPDDPGGNPGPTIEPEPPPDPGLRQAILDCLGLLSRRPAAALAARLRGEGAEPDRVLAERVGMRLNTFLQNVVRARRLLAECLESKGISTREYTA
jgi:RNA polymerase sigma-70 factor (ECF subfamily)